MSPPIRLACLIGSGRRQRHSEKRDETHREMPSPSLDDQHSSSLDQQCISVEESIDSGRVPEIPQIAPPRSPAPNQPVPLPMSLRNVTICLSSSFPAASPVASSGKAGAAPGFKCIDTSLSVDACICTTSCPCPCVLLSQPLFLPAVPGRARTHDCKTS